jgi:hypothetical protein
MRNRFHIHAMAFSLLALPALATGARAQDLNAFRAQHGRPALMADAQLAGIAQMHASRMAGGAGLTHAGFVAERASSSGTSAENVSYGCESEACAIAQWARSGGHRANMLRMDVSRYGLASATAANGRRYWALELGGDGGGRVIYVRGEGKGRRMTAKAAHMMSVGPIGRDLGIER